MPRVIGELPFRRRRRGDPQDEAVEVGDRGGVVTQPSPAPSSAAVAGDRAATPRAAGRCVELAIERLEDKSAVRDSDHPHRR
jgi:hypothetical protein